MDFCIDSTDPVLYLCDTEVEETREDSDVKVHKDECKIINDEESGAVKVLALFISFSRCSSKRGELVSIIVDIVGTIKDIHIFINKKVEL